MRNLISSGWRFHLVTGTLVLCFCAVIGRMWWIQVHTAEHYRNAADENRSVSQTYPASRGKIIDSRGNILAQNREVLNLRGDQELVTDEDRAKFPEIAKILGISETELREKLDPPANSELRPKRYVLIQEDVSKETANAVVKLLPRTVRSEKGGTTARSYFPISVERKFVRTYPLGERAAHLIGYTNREEKATAGIELALNRFLRGEDGWRESKRDGRRREQPRLRSRDVPARDGDTVQLTIDSSIQGYAEDACRKIVEEYSPISSTIIVSEAKTGRLLALANSPTYNLNEFNTAPIENQRNRAVTDIYEPGSVFKIVSIAAALEEKVVTEKSVFDCSITRAPYRGKMRALPKEDHEMEKLTVHEIIEKSSNRGSAQVAMRFCERFGEEAYVNYIHRFGFGKKTGLIGASGEVVGQVIPPKRWDGLTITRVPMGHSIAVTPLQTHYAMSVIASGGLLMEPQLILKISNEQTGKTFPFAPKARHRVISQNTAKSLARMLRDVCVNGTGKGADIKGYNVAGKTGTSQKIVNGRYSDDYYVASFSGFFPAENPRIVITVIIDGPTYYAKRWVTKRDANGRILRYPNGSAMYEERVVKTRAYGGTVAAPIFKEVAEKTIRWLELAPTASSADTER